MQGRSRGSTMAEELSGVLTWIKDALMKMNILDALVRRNFVRARSRLVILRRWRWLVALGVFFAQQP